MPKLLLSLDHFSCVRSIHTSARAATAQVILEATGIDSLHLTVALHRWAVVLINPRSSQDYQRACGTAQRPTGSIRRGYSIIPKRMPFVPEPHCPSV